MRYTTHWPLLSSATQASILPPPILVVRDPLPPFDPDTFESPDDYDPVPPPVPTPPSWHYVSTTLREDPPPKADVRWWRGDAWSITLPGLPPIPGGAGGPAQQRVLTYMLSRYDAVAGTGRQWETAILDQHGHNGYTHLSLSPQDDYAFGVSEDDFLRLVERCKKKVPFVHVLGRSKYYTPHDEPNLDDVNSLLTRLLDHGLVDVWTPAWEMNYWEPETGYAMVAHDHAIIGTRCHIRYHLYPHYLTWQANDETPEDFFRRNRGKIDGNLYQCLPAWTAGMAQARIKDCLDRVAPGGLYGGAHDTGRGHDFDFTVWEWPATQQFNNLDTGNNRLADEDTGNCYGFESLCAPGLTTVKGFGNGARRPGGEPL